MAYIYDIADTWNASGTTFTAIKMSVTDTASAAGSLLMDLQVGGVSRFSVSKAGVLSGPANSNNFSLASVAISTNNLFSASTAGLVGTYLFNGANSNIGLSISGNFPLSWSSTTGTVSDYANLNAVDLVLRRDAANTLAQRNGVNAQASRLYGTYTDASNYRRLTKTMSTGGVAEIKPEGAGTGASGNVLHISGLPTSNPGAGILWNNLGAVVVGT